MGVDFYPCQSCGGCFADCGHYVLCSCGRMWCSYECAADDDVDSCGDDDCDHYDCKTCNYCCKKEVEDSKLVEFLLAKLNWNREEAVKQFYTKNE